MEFVEEIVIWEMAHRARRYTQRFLRDSKHLIEPAWVLVNRDLYREINFDRRT